MVKNLTDAHKARPVLIMVIVCSESCFVNPIIKLNFFLDLIHVVPMSSGRSPDYFIGSAVVREAGISFPQSWHSPCGCLFRGTASDN